MKRKIESKIKLSKVEANMAIIRLTEFAFRKMNTPIGKKPKAGFMVYFLNPLTNIDHVFLWTAYLDEKYSSFNIY
jgi:hypothetical protein